MPEKSLSGQFPDAAALCFAPSGFPLKRSAFFARLAIASLLLSSLSSVGWAASQPPAPSSRKRNAPPPRPLLDRARRSVRRHRLLGAASTRAASRSPSPPPVISTTTASGPRPSGTPDAGRDRFRLLARQPAGLRAESTRVFSRNRAGRFPALFPPSLVLRRPNRRLPRRRRLRPGTATPTSSAASPAVERFISATGRGSFASGGDSASRAVMPRLRRLSASGQPLRTSRRLVDGGDPAAGRQRRPRL